MTGPQLSHPPSLRAITGRVLSFEADPREAGPSAMRLIEDGLVLIADGVVAHVGEAGEVANLPPGTPVDRHPGKLILPGFIDPHIHYPQTRVVASFGTELLDWLATYTFPEEQKFADPVHAASIATFFFDELFRNGTTTAAVYCTVHPQSVDAFFAESERRGTRMIAGKCLMDRNAPAGLLDTPQTGYDDTKALYARWHGRGRNLYAITPRFAVTSSEDQLAVISALARELPDAWMQTHLDENRAEIEFVRKTFPWANSYTDVYARHGILGPRTVLGHCIHMEDAEVRLLAETGSVAAFCPTSNLFLGSGLFDRARLRAAGIRVGLATDIGGGTSYSMLRTAAEAYKVLALDGQRMDGPAAFHDLTLGNAEALGLGDRIGRIAPGYEADLVVLDSAATPAMAHRMESARDLADELFVLATMGDDRSVVETYVAGRGVKGETSGVSGPEGNGKSLPGAASRGALRSPSRPIDRL